MEVYKKTTKALHLLEYIVNEMGVVGKDKIGDYFYVKDGQNLVRKIPYSELDIHLSFFVTQMLGDNDANWCKYHVEKLIPEYNPPLEYVSLRDCKLNVITGEFEDKEDGDYFLDELPISRRDVETSNGNVWQREEDKEKYLSVASFFGYAILKGISKKPINEQKFLHLWGQGGSGKSTIVNGFRRIFPNSFIPKSMSELLESSFGRADIIGKAVISIDEGKFKRETIDLLKTLTAGEALSIDRKYKTPLTTDDYGVVVITSNHILDFGDNNGGLARRIVSIKLNNKIENVDRSYWDKSKTIANWLRFFLAGIKDYSKNGLLLTEESKVFQKDFDVVNNLAFETLCTLYTSGAYLGLPDTTTTSDLRFALEGCGKQFYNSKEFGYFLRDFCDLLKIEKKRTNSGIILKGNIKEIIKEFFI